MKKFIILGEQYSSKNSHQIFRGKNGKPFITKSSASKKSEKVLIQELIYRKHEWYKFIEGLEYPYCLKLFIYRKTIRQFDYTNIYQNLFDCMTKAGFIKDDSMLYLKPVYEGWAKDKDNPRVEISI